VLDEKGDFEQRCNMAMIDLAPIAEEEVSSSKRSGGKGNLDSHGLVDILSNMDANDVARLRELIERHARYTNSGKAKSILADWAGWLPKFRKVMPTEYARALAEMASVQAADTTGFNVMEVGMPAKKGTGKGKAAG
jgi:glutamate synthase (NADPH) large chain